MNLSGLSLEQAPPISVPFRFFLSAPFIASLAPIFCLIYLPMQSRWEPIVLFSTHLIVVGYVLMVMIGALFQLVPVVGGVSFRFVRFLGGFTFIGLLLILLALLLSFLGQGFVLAPWSPLLLVPFAIFFVEVLSRAKSSYETVGAFRLAGLGFWMFLLLGGVLLMLRYDPQMLGVRLVSTLARPWGTDLHWLWALMGWVFPIVAGVSFQVLPMFFVTPPYSQIFKKLFPSVLLLILFEGTLELLIFHQVHLFRFFATVFVSFFCLLSLNLLRKRKRKVRDLSVWFWRFSLIFALVAMILSYLLVWLGPHGELLFGITILLGTLVSLISAMLYKIVPFLIWFHLQSTQMTFQLDPKSPVMPPKPLPTMKDLISDQKVLLHFILHSTGFLLLLFGFEVSVLRNIAFFILALGFLLQGLFVVSAYRQYSRFTAMFLG